MMKCPYCEANALSTYCTACGTITPQQPITDRQGRTWRVMEREDGSISVYYTRPGVDAHFVVFDTLDEQDHATLRAENEALREALGLIAAGSPPTPGDDRIPVAAADVARAALAKGGER